MNLALSMIVKNAARFLPQCLESVRGVVQEIVVGDTGSSDETVQIAQGFAARVIHIPWNNDFADARNRCLDEVRSGWVLSLDADEMLDPCAVLVLPRLLENAKVGGYQVTIRNFVLSLQDRIWDRAAHVNNSELAAGKPYPAYIDHQNVRLFRNEEQIRFVGRVHESVGPSLLQNKQTIGSADFVIYHFGLALAAEERAAKNRYYRELGRQKLSDFPNDAQAHLELGLVELDNFSNLEEAGRLFARACTLNPRLGTAWFFQGLVLLRLERFADALSCLEKAETLGQGTSSLAETKGDAHYNSGGFREALSSYKTALRREPGSPWLRSKLGLTLVRLGKMAEGISELNEALRERRDAPELHDRLMLAYLSAGELARAAETLEGKLASVAAPTASDFLRAASLCSKVGQSSRAFKLVELGLQRFPNDEKLLIARQELSNLIAVEPVTSAQPSS